MRIWKGGKLVWTFALFSSQYLLRLQVEVLVNASWGRYHSVGRATRQGAPRISGYSKSFSAWQCQGASLTLARTRSPKVSASPGALSAHLWHRTCLTPFSVSDSLGFFSTLCTFTVCCLWWAVICVWGKETQNWFFECFTTHGPGNR